MSFIELSFPLVEHQQMPGDDDSLHSKHFSDSQYRHEESIRKGKMTSPCLILLKKCVSTNDYCDFSIRVRFMTFYIHIREIQRAYTWITTT
jgi:hypothetical protein